jgi:hypothetical protein
MGNGNNKLIDKNYKKLKNDDKSIMICRVFNYCNLDNNQDVIITINMESTKINKNQNNSIQDDISDKYLFTEYNKIFNTFVNNKNIQKNTIYIKANEYKSIPICYYYDDWKGSIKLNGSIIVKNLKFNKKVRYDVIDINKCNKNFYDNHYQLYKNMKISTLNNCISVSFVYNNIRNETLYFGINVKSQDYGKQSNIYEVEPLKYFQKTFCFYNTDWNTNENDLNWIVSNNNFTELYYCDLNFILNKNIFNIEVKIENYPYNKSFTKLY